MVSERARNAARGAIELSMTDPEAAEKLREEFDRAIRPAVKKLQAELAHIGKGWEAEFGQPYPQSRDDWRRWASRIGMTPVDEKELSAAEMIVYIEGYCQRLQDRAKPAEPADTKTDKARKIMKWNPAAQKCLDTYHAEQQVDPSIVMKYFVFEWAEQNGESQSTLYKRFTDNPDRR